MMADALCGASGDGALPSVVFSDVDGTVLDAAFGDGRNDIDMLRAVPQSWAMANSPAEVRAAAARVTALDNDHDGLAETIFSLLGES